MSTKNKEGIALVVVIVVFLCVSVGGGFYSQHQHDKKMDELNTLLINQCSVQKEALVEECQMKMDSCADKVESVKKETKLKEEMELNDKLLMENLLEVLEW